MKKICNGSSKLNKLHLNIFCISAVIDIQRVRSLQGTPLSVMSDHTDPYNLKQGNEAVCPIVAMFHSQVIFALAADNNLDLNNPILIGCSNLFRTLFEYHHSNSFYELLP